MNDSKHHGEPTNDATDTPSATPNTSDSAPEATTSADAAAKPATQVAGAADAAAKPAPQAAGAAGAAGAATPAPSQQELAVRGALESVMDPEIGLSVIDLGLIREVHFLPGQTLIRMMLTTPFCPYAPQMVEDVKQATMAVVPQPCDVELMPDPWSPDLMPDPGLLGYSF